MTANAAGVPQKNSNNCCITLAALLLATLLPLQAFAQNPFLIVEDSEYQELRDRAANPPWDEWKLGATDALNYRYEDTPLTDDQGNTLSATHLYQRRASVLSNAFNRAALAHILYPGDDRYKSHIVDQFQGLEDLLATRTDTASNRSWGHTIFSGKVFFYAILALDIVHDDVTTAELAEMEGIAQAFYDYTLANYHGSWRLATDSVLSLWAFYKNDQPNAAQYADLYIDRVKSFIAADGVGYLGGSYSDARLSGSETSKTYFMDVLTRLGVHDFYNDPQLVAFYEWFYGAEVTPLAQRAVFNHTTAKQTYSDRTASYRTGRFSSKAAAHARWVRESINPEPAPQPASTWEGNTDFLLRYLLVEDPYPASQPPQSVIYPMGGFAAMYEDVVAPDSLSAHLFSLNGAAEHAVRNTNSIHLNGYGKNLVMNSGYNGWGKGAGLNNQSFSWDYMNTEDAHAGNDYAVGGNIVYFDREHPHQKNYGAGINEGFTGSALDYASGDSGSAIKDGHHVRNLVFVKSTAQNNGYFLLFDEVSKTDQNLHTSVKSALHVVSEFVNTVTEDTAYQWDLGDGDFMNLFLATPAASASHLKLGGLSQINADLPYLHVEYAMSAGAGSKSFVTIAFPTDASHTLATMNRILGSGYTGASIEHSATLVDKALESDGQITVSEGGNSFQGRALWYREVSGSIDAYFVREGQAFHGQGGQTDYGFTASTPVSIYLQGATGKVISTGTHVNFYWPGITGVKINDELLANVAAGDGFVSVLIPEGNHALQLDTSGAVADSALAISSVTASGNDGNLAINTLDNDLGTRWSSYGDGEWIQYQMEEVYSLARIELAFYLGDQRQAYFELSTSIDGINWQSIEDVELSGQQITSGGNTVQKQAFHFAPVAARYLRIIGHGNSQSLWNSYSEFSAHGQIYTSPTDFESSKDGYVRDGNYANDNYGSRNYLVIKSSGLGYSRRSYLEFDLSEFSAGSVSEAKFRFKLNVVDTNSTNLNIASVTQDSWIESALTWNNAPTCDVSQATVVVQDSEIDQWKEVDITGYVNQSLSQRRIGICIEQLSASDQTYVSLKSRESGEAPQIRLKP